MRLISAGKLMDETPEMRDKDERVSRNACIADYIYLLCDSPTAYDVDRVVEKLYDCKKGVDDAISDDEFFRSGVKTGLTMAIEIVKKGGIE